MVNQFYRLVKMAFTKLPLELTKSYTPHDQRIIRRPFLINVAVGTQHHLEDLKAADVRERNVANHSATNFEQQMAGRAVGEKDVFLGISGFKSLDLISLIGVDTGKRYQKAVLVDVNEQQEDSLERILPLIEQNDTPDKFIEAFAKAYPDYMAMPSWKTPRGWKKPQAREWEKEKTESHGLAFGVSYQPPASIIKSYLERFTGPRNKDPLLAKEASWLEEKNYQVIRAMVKAGDIQVAHMDLRDSTQINAMKKWLDDQELRVGDMYLSSLLGFAQDDYYSHTKTSYGNTGGVEQAKKMYNNLLSLTDEKSRYVCSVANPLQSILHTYHLESIDRSQFEKKKEELPDKEPAWDEKKWAALFSAGGKEWRLNSFDTRTNWESPIEKEDKEHRYFRIFSEQTPPEFRQSALLQIKRINSLLEKMATDDRSIAFIDVKSLDTVFFDNEEAHSKAGHSAMLSSRPFVLTAGATEDTLENLMSSIHATLPQIRRIKER